MDGPNINIQQHLTLDVVIPVGGLLTTLKKKFIQLTYDQVTAVN